MEVWKQIKNYEDYFISNLGKVKSCKNKKERILKLREDSNKRYLYAHLCKNGKHKMFSVHRLVLKTFNNVENSENLEVNHKDYNVKNNNINNLEWVTRKENIKHAFLKKDRKKSMFFKDKKGILHNKSIEYILKCPDGNVKSFYSGAEFKRLTGLDNSNLSYAKQHCKLPHIFNRGTIKGYILLDYKEKNYLKYNHIELVD